MAKAIWNGRVIAESAATVEVDGYRYFPRDSVKMDLLRAAAKTPSDLQCPHGVQFFDVSDGKQTSARNAWSYERPGKAMQRIDRWVGFWDAVTVQA